MDTITTIEDSLKIDSHKEEQRIIQFVQEKLQELNRDGAVIGLSGGLDSSTCAYILEQALGKKRFLQYYCPNVIVAL